jgi:hypothetical protein
LSHPSRFGLFIVFIEYKVGQVTLVVGVGVCSWQYLPASLRTNQPVFASPPVCKSASILLLTALQISQYYLVSLPCIANQPVFGPPVIHDRLLLP